MAKACGLFLMTLLLGLVLATTAHAAAFEGRWVGHWQNSLGEQGRDSLTLDQSAFGELRGFWTGHGEVWGEKTSGRSAHLQGRDREGTSYDITLRRDHNVIELHYYATRPDGSTYEGWSSLHRRE